MHTTNYSDTLICPAEDCLSVGKVPDKPESVAALQYELLVAKPYAFTSDDVLVAVAARRQGVEAQGMDRFRAEFFSKGQPCLRASPLTKTFGWAIHSDNNGCVALVSPKAPRFSQLLQDETVQKVNAMRSKRA